MKVKKPGASEGGMKDLILQHIEKGVMGIVVILVGVFIYLGTQQKTIDEKLREPAILAAADQARRNINSQTWLEVDRERFTVSGAYKHDVYDDLARKDVKDIALASYELNLPPTGKRLFPPRNPRTDPELFPVEELEVRPGLAALAMSGEGDDGGGFAGAARRRSDAASLLGAAGGEESSEDRPEPPVLNIEQQMAAGSGYQARGQAVPKSYAFISVTGLVPIQKQNEEYERCFVDAAGHNPARDMPDYIYFYVERAEVGPDGKPTTWERLNTSRAKSFEEKWAGSATEIAALEYVYTGPNGFTRPIPPILMQDLAKWALHSKVPRQKTESDAETEVDETDDESETGDSPDVPGLDLPGGPRRSTSTEETGDRRPRSGATPESEDPAERQVDYQMFRFFDFTVEPDKAYQYRVQLLLADPNDPRQADPNATKGSESVYHPVPAPSQLAQSVVDRLRDRKSEEQKLGRDIFWRETPFSAPSAATRIPDPTAVLVAQVTPPRSVNIPGTNQKLRIREAEANALAVVWDEAKAMHVPGIIESVARGTWLNFQKGVWVFEPIGLNVEWLDGYDFATDTLLLDIQGGEQLPSERRKDVETAIGKFLLLDGNGNLVVRSEFGDTDEFARFHYAPPPEEEESPGSRRRRRDQEGEEMEGRDYGGLIGG